MLSDDIYLPSPRPFWFASEDLLIDILHAEIKAVNQLFARHPELPNLFDRPQATVPQRNACFELLACRKIMEIVDEALTSRYVVPSLGDRVSSAFRRTQNLVATDAPAWVLEMNEVVELLPSRIYAVLPEPLRMGGFDSKNPAQVEAIESAAKTLSSVEQIRDFAGKVIDQQLQRLKHRWSASAVRTRRPNKRKGWEQREKLYGAIQKALNDNPALQGMALCADLDKRHSPPLYDWTKRGEWREGLTWKEAWGNPALRRKIRRVRQEAMKSRS